MAKNKQTIFVFCAHSDDQILGPGATIAKYAKEGKRIQTVIFSYGENALPWLKPSIARKTRVEEAKEADKVIGGKGVAFLGLKEGKFLEEAGKIKEKIQKALQAEKPIKIFTHSHDDPHPDHRAVNKIIMECVEKAKYKGDVYLFDVWNPFTIRKTDLPKLYEDITETFKIKVKALKVFESQKPSIWALFWSVYAKALIHGFHINKRYAERFFKAR